VKNFIPDHCFYYLKIIHIIFTQNVILHIHYAYIIAFCIIPQCLLLKQSCLYEVNLPLLELNNKNLLLDRTCENTTNTKIA